MRVVLDDGRDDLPAVVVDYAHTPDAIRAALEALRPVTAGTLVCVTGAAWTFGRLYLLPTQKHELPRDMRVAPSW